MNKSAKKIDATTITEISTISKDIAIRSSDKVTIKASEPTQNMERVKKNKSQTGYTFSTILQILINSIY